MNIHWCVCITCDGIFICVFQVGMGGDHRAEDAGAHVRQPDHGRVCVGPATRRQNVSTPLMCVWGGGGTRHPASKCEYTSRVCVGGRGDPPPGIKMWVHLLCVCVGDLPPASKCEFTSRVWAGCWTRCPASKCEYTSCHANSSWQLELVMVVLLL